MKRKSCAICNFNLKNICLINNVPTKLSCTSVPINDTSPLSFSQCENCNTIQLDELIPLNILYAESHNYVSVGKTWQNYFKLFYNKIQNIIKDKNILEIGCPSGKIAMNVKNYNKWFIVEPNKNTEIRFDEKITFIEKFFDNNFILDEKINIIIHSHLFEHIYDFNEFLTKCNNILCNDGEMFFGIPNMNHFLNTNICPFLGIFFEHTCFLNKENMKILLNNNNFELIECIDYENHSILYHCKKKMNNIINYKITNYYDYFFESINNYKIYIEKCNNIIMNTKNEVYIFGASYNSQFLISLGLDLTYISGILDNCKEKQNKFLYGYNLKIYDPKIIVNKNCIIILKNGYYTNEILTQIYDLNINTHIIL
jgi:2-polyprenyl-3-methyl-5-hydroxy-6-metoxy-1,4-benzoquinol methylase